MRMPSRSLVLPSTKIGLTSVVVVFAIAIILLPSNITIINAQQQQLPTISQSPAEVAQNGATTLFQSTTDGIRLNVPEGWIVHDVNNTGSTRSEESRQGYGILAQLCPQELQQQQEQQRTAPSNVSRSSRDTSTCQGSEGDVIHIVRYPDLDVRLQEVSSNITAHNNMTIDNILLYHMQKLEEVGYSRIQIVNSTDTTLNVTNATNAQTNQTIATVPARLVEVTYSTASAPNVIREGYFMLTATDETRPSIGMTKGYSIFYEGASISTGAATPATIQQTTTSTPFVSLPSRQPLPIAVQQIFDSVELIVVSEVAQDMPPGQSEQVQQQEVAQEPTNPLTVDITSRGTEGEGDVGIAPATFEFQVDIAGGTEPYSYRWDFDDGSSSEESDDDVVDHTFEEAGTYSIGLTVTDSDGQTASDIIEITVEEALAEESVATEEEEEEEEEAPSLPRTIIEPPAEEEEEQPITTEQPLTVDITSSDTEGRVIAPTTFEFEADVAGGTEPYTISWNFDDEGTSSEEIHDDETISHTFEEAGKYNVVAIVTDSSGQRAADTIRITVEEAPSLPSVIRELAEQGEDATNEDDLPPQQQDQQSDAAPSTGATEEIPSEQPTAQGNNQGGEQGEAATARPPSVTQSIQQNTSQSMQVGIPNGGTSSEERSDHDDNDENVDHIFGEAGSHNRGRTVTNIEDQRVSDSVESKVEAALVEPPEEEEPSTQGIPAEQPTAGEVNPDLFDADNNSDSDDLIDVDDVFDVDGFIDGLFDKLGLDN